VPAPFPGDRHVDQPLTDFSVTYLQDPNMFAARRIFPVVGSPKASNKYSVYTKSFFLRSEARDRAPGTESAVRGYELSKDTYFCHRKSIAVDVTEEDIANQDSGLDAERDAAALCMQDLSIAEEVDFAAAAFVTGKWGTSTTPGVLWDDAASTPLENINTGRKTIHEATGKQANVLALGADVWYALQNHPDLVARMPDNSNRMVTRQWLASLLELDEIIVSGAVRNTAGEGVTEVDDFILGKHALLLHRASNPGPRTPTAGVTFVWTGLQGAAQGVRTKRIEIPEKSIVARIETDTAYDHKIVSTDLGYMWVSVVA
jgi:hypothetical protein